MTAFRRGGMVAFAFASLGGAFHGGSSYDDDRADVADGVDDSVNGIDWRGDETNDHEAADAVNNQYPDNDLLPEDEADDAFSNENDDAGLEEGCDESDEADEPYIHEEDHHEDRDEDEGLIEENENEDGEDEDQADAREGFNRGDLDQNGFLDQYEINAVRKTYKLPKDFSIMEYDEDHNGRLDLAEFTAVVRDFGHEEDRRHEKKAADDQTRNWQMEDPKTIKAYFDNADNDRSGFLDVGEIESVLAREHAPSKIKWSEYDDDKDARISLREFYLMNGIYLDEETASLGEQAENKTAEFERRIAHTVTPSPEEIDAARAGFRLSASPLRNIPRYVNGALGAEERLAFTQVQRGDQLSHLAVTHGDVATTSSFAEDDFVEYDGREAAEGSKWAEKHVTGGEFEEKYKPESAEGRLEDLVESP
eukprot:TRINITY_DN76280_c0_g1_i1.p1 TRINITY_DN76280_c0_g1~~TRINITY_DN76280_c0_g1_i1.p1  ORF type:complete len:422 (+),score=92.13 TRINITY_DN76280_c0_g1_i1:72-1337(+)